MAMTYEALLEILKHMSYTEEGKKLLKMPVVVTNCDQKKFLIVNGSQVLKDMGNMFVLNTKNTTTK